VGYLSNVPIHPFTLLGAPSGRRLSDDLSFEKGGGRANDGLRLPPQPLVSNVESPQSFGNGQKEIPDLAISHMPCEDWAKSILWVGFCLGSEWKEVLSGRTLP